MQPPDDENNKNGLPATFTSGFSLAPRNLEEAMKLAEMICNTEIVPKNFKGKAGDTLVAMILGSEVGLNPLQSLSNIAVINGRPSIWGDAMLALCLKNPNFNFITETLDPTTMTATCTVSRKGGVPHPVTFSEECAKTAGLLGTGWPVDKLQNTNTVITARPWVLRFVINSPIPYMV